MSFQDIFKSSFLENVTEFSLLDTCIGLAAALLVGLFIFMIYKNADRSSLLRWLCVDSRGPFTGDDAGDYGSNVKRGIVPRYGRRSFYCPFPNSDQRAGGDRLSFLVSGRRNCHRRRNDSAGDHRFRNHRCDPASFCQSENPETALHSGGELQG